MQDKEILQAFENHSKEDHEAFDKINKTIDKSNKLIETYGEHMSFIRLDLTEVRNILTENAKKTEEYRNTVNNLMEEDRKFKERVEPVIKRFEEQKLVDETIKNGINKVGVYAKLITYITIIGGAVIYIFKKVL